MSPSDRPKPPNRGPSADLPEPDDPPSEEELRAAEALRRVLDGEGGGRSELARAIRAAASTQSISPERHQQILDRTLAAVAPEEARRVVVALRPRKSKIGYLAVGVAASALAAAAAVVLLIRGQALDASLASKAMTERRGGVLALSRSTTGLFPEGIPRSGGTTDRVDRIAYARAQDFRQNQFARWGAP